MLRRGRVIGGGKAATCASHSGAYSSPSCLIRLGEREVGSAAGSEIDHWGHRGALAAREWRCRRERHGGTPFSVIALRRDGAAILGILRIETIGAERRWDTIPDEFSVFFPKQNAVLARYGPPGGRCTRTSSPLQCGGRRGRTRRCRHGAWQDVRKLCAARAGMGVSMRKFNGEVVKNDGTELCSEKLPIEIPCCGASFRQTTGLVRAL